MLFTIGLGTVVAVLVAILGASFPLKLSLCQNPVDGTLCPSGGSYPSGFDVPLVMFLGVLGATVAAIFALRKVRGTTDPYSLAVALALLKLPTGALTAFLGPFLIGGGFMPGWANFDNQQQYLAYCILFGYSQELFTGIVDRQAAAVLSNPQPAPTPPH